MAKKPTKPSGPRIVRGKAAKSRKAAAAPAPTKTSKQDQVLTLLRRQNGASIDEIVAATDWQPHSVRGFLSGAVKRRLGIDIVSEKGEDGVRRYVCSASPWANLLTQRAADPSELLVEHRHHVVGKLQAFGGGGFSTCL